MHAFVVAGICGFLAVFFGAFGSHVLKATLGEKFFSIFQTANQYHFWHTLAILGVAILAERRPQRFFTFSQVFFVVGLFMFSGSLYLYAIYNTKIFAMLAPIGGTAFMIGWLFLILGSIKAFAEPRGA